jgi:hypothetical protein
MSKSRKRPLAVSESPVPPPKKEPLVSPLTGTRLRFHSPSYHGEYKHFHRLMLEWIQDESTQLHIQLGTLRFSASSTPANPVLTLRSMIDPVLKQQPCFFDGDLNTATYKDGVVGCPEFHHVEWYVKRHLRNKTQGSYQKIVSDRRFVYDSLEDPCVYRHECKRWIATHGKTVAQCIKATYGVPSEKMVEGLGVVYICNPCGDDRRCNSASRDYDFCARLSRSTDLTKEGNEYHRLATASLSTIYHHPTAYAIYSFNKTVQYTSNGDTEKNFERLPRSFQIGFTLTNEFRQCFQNKDPAEQERLTKMVIEWALELSALTTNHRKILEDSSSSSDEGGG